MTSLATHKVTPNLISPYDLRNILLDVQKKLVANPKLSLPTDTTIWSYYQFLKIDAVMSKNLLVVVLTLPLIDKDLEFHLFQAHNLPLLHPDMKKVFTYELENQYLAIRSDGNYITIPDHDDVLTCQISAGHFCNLNTPLYPTSRTTFCPYHLFVNDKDKILAYCKMNIVDYQHDTAINLGQNIWALSILEPVDLHVTCLTQSYDIRVTTNFHLIELENSCQAYSPSIILPSSNIIKSEYNQSLIEERFFNYDVKYTSIPNFFVMNVFSITQLSEDKLNELALDLPPIRAIPMRNISALLTPIDKNYPFTMPIYGYVLITIGGTSVIIMIIGLIYYAKFRRAKAAAKPVVRYRNNKPPSKEEIEIQFQTATSTNPRVKSPATPLLLKETLEKEYNIDFSGYDKKRRNLVI